MTPTDENMLCYRLHKESSGHYTQQYLSIFYGERKSLRSDYEGTIGNKAGYGSPEAAQRIGQWFRHLLDMGFDTHIEMDTWKSKTPHILIRWQEYNPSRHSHGSAPGYCAAEIERMGRGSFMDIHNGADFLWRLGLDISKNRDAMLGYNVDEEPADPGDWVLNRPSVVVHALERMGGVRVDLIRGAHMSTYVVATSPRPWLRETLANVFELGHPY
jgi:hypothetical protein